MSIFNKTNFGFQRVTIDEKSHLVNQVFHSVAPYYDLMNDLMSFGLHRWWKKIIIERALLHKGQMILDIASGTGDLALALAEKMKKRGQIILTDINESMLRIGKARLIDQGYIGNIFYVQANAEELPFKNNYFDCLTIAFGLRNVTNQIKALRQMYDVLKPGGRVLILEFSKPQSASFRKFYDLYSMYIIPKIGKYIAHDEASYRYLVESIRMHPDQETMKKMLLEAGFDEVTYTNLTGGVVALHIGYKF